MTKNDNAASLAEGEQNETDKRLKLMYTLTVGVVIVLFTFVVGIMFSYLQSRAEAEATKQATYQSLRDQVKEQNDKIDSLTDEVNNLTRTVQDGQKTN